MRTTLLLLALLAGPAFAGHTVWKWVDAQGVTHYSDQPVPGATRMELNTSSPSSSSAAASYGTSSDSARQDENSGPPYRNLEIWKPSPEETIPNTGGRVTINVRIEPALQPGHSLFLYLDGRALDQFPGNTQSFELTDVARGTHTAVAVVVNQRGDRLQESAPVTFYVRQESVAQPPTGPALRPPPKPQPRAGNKANTSQPTYAALTATPPTAAVDPVTNRPIVKKPSAKSSAPKSGN